MKNIIHYTNLYFNNMAILYINAHDIECSLMWSSDIGTELIKPTFCRINFATGALKMKCMFWGDVPFFFFFAIN